MDRNKLEYWLQEAKQIKGLPQAKYKDVAKLAYLAYLWGKRGK